jgi:SAM-dependent methyltransferase
MNIMSNNRVLEYNINTINIDDIEKSDNEIVNHYWSPNPIITEYLCDTIEESSIVFDVGCGSKYTIFPKATHVLGIKIGDIPEKLKKVDFDLDFDKFNYDKDSFDFVYCRHTLEDIQNPQNAFNEIVRIGKRGYIETPSPLIEIMKYAEKVSYRGYIHHRYIIWSDSDTNTLFFLPKYPIIESIILSEELEGKFRYILNNYPVYWNNYYTWDVNNPPKIHVYRNEINFIVNTDYAKLINIALNASIENTNKYTTNLKIDNMRRA